MAEDEAGQRGNRSARTVARALGLLLIAGGALAALGDTGFGRMVNGNVGYAGFGYIPQQCGDSSRSVRAINGDVVRACQSSSGQTHGFFVGHRAYPISNAQTAMHVALPDAKLHFAWRGGGSSAVGTWRSFTAPTFGSVLAGNPVTASERFAGWDGATKYLDVVRTTRISSGASAYTMTWAITNTSGVAQRIRPLVSTTSYGYGPPTWSTAPTPRRVTAHNPLYGGSITLGESDVGGSPAVLGFTSGSWTRTNAATAPNAPALDSVLHADGATWSDDSEMALAWPIRTLAANATATYSATIAMALPREVILKLSGGVPTAYSPTLVDAAVSEDRPVAGRYVRWWTTSWGRDPVEGAAPIDGTGHAALSIPGRQGERHLRVYVDTNGDGLEGDDEPAETGYIYAPPGGPPPTPPRGRVGEPAGAATRRGQARARRGHARLLPGEGSLQDLQRQGRSARVDGHREVPEGVRAQVLHQANAKGTVSLKSLVGSKKIKPGTTITVTVSHPGQTPRSRSSRCAAAASSHRSQPAAWRRARGRRSAAFSGERPITRLRGQRVAGRRGQQQRCGVGRALQALRRAGAARQHDRRAVGLRPDRVRGDAGRVRDIRHLPVGDRAQRRAGRVERRNERAQIGLQRAPRANPSRRRARP